jgi:general stress protein YciG
MEPRNQDQGINHSSTSRRGFASMDQNRQREIASKGGKMAHAKGTAHEFNSEEGRLAGRKGGEAVSQNREHMAEIGRRGGEASGASNHSPRGKNHIHNDSDEIENQSDGSPRGPRDL